MSDSILLVSVLYPYAFAIIGVILAIWSFLSWRRNKRNFAILIGGVATALVGIAIWKFATFKITGWCTVTCEKLKSGVSLEQSETDDLQRRCPPCPQ